MQVIRATGQKNSRLGLAEHDGYKHGGWSQRTGRDPFFESARIGQSGKKPLSQPFRTGGEGC